MRASRAGLGSIGVHLVVLGAAYAWQAGGADAVRPRMETEAPPAIDITFVEPSVSRTDPTVVPPSAPGSDTVTARPPISTPDLPVVPPLIAAIAPDPRPAPSALMISPSPSSRGPSAAAPTASIETGIERPAETAPVPRSHWNRMRRPDLRPPDEALARIANAGRPPEPEPRPSGKLVQQGREHVAVDLVTPMRVREDGTIAFHDKGDFEVHWALPIPSRKGIGKLLSDWYRDPYAQTRARRVQDMPRHEQAVEGGWDAGAGGDGAPAGHTREAGSPATGGPTVPIVGGSFDLTAWAMRKAKVGDPYASRKRSLIHATYDERVQISSAYRARQLDRTAELMQRNLDTLARRRLPPTALREALFALWDECTEGEGPTGEAGQRARSLVIGRIRAHLPALSADAYSPAEIARLDGRRSSRQHFAPY